MLVGYRNANLAETEDNGRDEEIASVLSYMVLQDMSGHFLPHHTSHACNSQTWIMVCWGVVVQYQTNYIIGKYHRLSQNVSVQDPRHNTYHYMFLGCFLSRRLEGSQRYLGLSTHLPLRPPGFLTREDVIFAGLRCAISKLERMDGWRAPYITVETWIYMDDRVAFCSSLTQYFTRTRMLG